MALSNEQLKFFKEDYQKKYVIECVELSHSSFTKTYNLVKYTEPLVIKGKEYLPSNFKVTLPSFKEKLEQTINFSLDVIDKQVIQELNNVQNTADMHKEKIKLTLIAYKYGDFDNAIIGPLNFEVSDWSIQNYTLTAQAKIGDYINTAFPRDIYTPANLPSLELFNV